MKWTMKNKRRERCKDQEGQQVNLVAERSWGEGKRLALPQSALSALPTNPRGHWSRYRPKWT